MALDLAQPITVTDLVLLSVAKAGLEGEADTIDFVIAKGEGNQAESPISVRRSNNTTVSWQPHRANHHRVWLRCHHCDLFERCSIGWCGC